MHDAMCIGDGLDGHRREETASSALQLQAYSYMTTDILIWLC